MERSLNESPECFYFGSFLKEPLIEPLLIIDTIKCTIRIVNCKNRKSPLEQHSKSKRTQN